MHAAAAGKRAFEAEGVPARISLREMIRSITGSLVAVGRGVASSSSWTTIAVAFGVARPVSSLPHQACQQLC